MTDFTPEQIELTGKQVGFYLCEIAKLFPDEFKVTLVIRHETNPEHNSYLSDDPDVEAVCKVLKELQGKKNFSYTEILA